MLEDTAGILLDEYKGDLRNLREAAERDTKKERNLLKKFKGIGDVGVDIFFREIQAVWDELMPFADKKALKAAKRLDLGKSASDLAKLVKKGDFTRLIAGLVRIDLDNQYAEIGKSIHHPELKKLRVKKMALSVSKCAQKMAGPLIFFGLTRVPPSA